MFLLCKRGWDGGGGGYDVSTSATQCSPLKEEGEAAMGCSSCLSQVTGGSSVSYEDSMGRVSDDFCGSLKRRVYAGDTKELY